MDTEILFDWLERLDWYVGQTQDGKIVLLIDNCTAHGAKETLLVLTNISVEFLAPKPKRKIQPLDAGITPWVKAKHKRQLLLRVVEKSEAEKISNYNVEVLTAIC